MRPLCLLIHGIILKRKKKKTLYFFLEHPGHPALRDFGRGYYNYGDVKQDKQLAVKDTNKIKTVNRVDRVEGVDKTGSHNDQNFKRMKKSN